jgi:hypothetical protein
MNLRAAAIECAERVELDAAGNLSARAVRLQSAVLTDHVDIRTEPRSDSTSLRPRYVRDRLVAALERAFVHRRGEIEDVERECSAPASASAIELVEHRDHAAVRVVEPALRVVDDRVRAD